MIHIAACPILLGAIAAIDNEGGVVLCEGLHFVSHGDQDVNVVDAQAFRRQLVTAREGDVRARLTITRWNPTATNSSEMFWRGIVLGSILTAAQPSKLIVDVVKSADWKRYLGIGMHPGWHDHKSELMAMVNSLFPGLDLEGKRAYGRAEALLLAEYSRRKHLEEVPA